MPASALPYASQFEALRPKLIAFALLSHWKNPEDLHLRSNFWETFDFCLLHLPINTARVFALREFMDLDTAEICDCLDISEQNCWTILHRARLKLRSCLERGWFLKEGTT
ncbi:sigma factor-like helix-turn-helix DNA-binding protein [Neptunomonas sp.]|uniref:sigma factor-like helix-turn-helix DNA-binding protein n=1 Tax=Neptunomonas sp. TaxID=1971898 RepID=UPI0025D5214E|nr:sigma factor-like helix-turn-helix DNA-binding protein [Neptunomonas sp.]